MTGIFSVLFSISFNTNYFIALKQIYINIFRMPPTATRIHPIPQLPRTFKSHNSSRRQHHILTGSRVPSFPLTFILDTDLPNPEIRTSSPDARVDLTILRIVSTVSNDFLRLNPFCSAVASIKWNFVRVIVGSVKLNVMVLVTGAPVVGSR